MNSEGRNIKIYAPANGSIFKKILGSAGIFLLMIGCGGDTAVRPDETYSKPLAPMGYTIQVGAFANINNAVRLTEKLQNRGLNAYHFLHQSGLYKVRFGNYQTKASALSRAHELQKNGIIDTFYIVTPEDYAAAGNRRYVESETRNNIVKTAKGYIGIPYRWGGDSPGTGFDCSGFTMVVYRLNGLNLPRSSSGQWRAGKSVRRSQLSKGDLVFFATSGGKKVSHVGIYLGGDKFLHAPGKGRRIKASSLADNYFQKRFVGARSYL
jgi:cell wall-associated NlpC family hydrolase